MKAHQFSLLLGLFVLLMAHGAYSALTINQQNAMTELCGILNTTLGWSCETNPCAWEFVLCDENESTVLRISAHLNDSVVDLDDAIPSSIGFLADLEELTLNGLGLVSPLPPSIGTINSLQKIDLARNSFSEPLIPFQNTFLRHLNVSSNAFAGSFPTLDSVPSIEILDISKNNFDGPILTSHFLNTPNISVLIASNNAFSGNVSFSSVQSWSTIDMNGNEFELCNPAPQTPLSAADRCSFSNQRSSCGSCASFWSNCEVSLNNVNCTTTPLAPGEGDGSSTLYLVPLRHCWELVGSDTYAYFGYESNAVVDAVDVQMNISNGVVYLSPSGSFDEGRVELSILILVDNATMPVTLDFGTGESQTIEIGVDSSRCPNISLHILASYPSALNMTNLTEEVHDLYASALPYPSELLEVTNRENLERAPGDVEIVLYPGEFVSAFIASSQLKSRPLPESEATGTAIGKGVLITPIPVSGGSVSPSLGSFSDSPIGPPSFTSSAKGAIALCVIIGFLIVVIAVVLTVLGKSSKLPVASKEDQDKSIRSYKKSIDEV